MKLKAKPTSFDKKENTFQNYLLFAKNNKGFLVALIIFLGSILFLQLFLTQDYAQEKATYAQEMYTNNQTEINYYINLVEEQLIEEKEDILDDYFLASTRGDFIWLKEKEQELFNSKPNGDLYAKEAAFSVFLLKIIELNEAFSIQMGDPDFNYIIESAISEQIAIPFLISQERLIVLFDGDVREANIFSNTINYLFNDYISLKKKMISQSDVLEAKYVESKKLLLVPELGEYEE